VTGTDLEIQLIGVLVAAACALPGVFLVLRRMALLSDAISHTVLLGIVLAFFLVQDLASPLLVVAAAAVGVLTVWLVETIRGTGRVKEDAAIGLVFPLLFSIAVLLVSRFAGNVHLDTDAVLLGELAFAPFRRLVVGGVDLGPRSLWVMGGVFLVGLTFVVALYKELKLTTFDPELAAALGFPPAVVHYAFMSVVSVTAVGAFDAVGSILVVAFMIAPPAAAYLLSDHLPRVLAYAVLIGAASAVAGYQVARAVDASIAGTMASMTGVAFVLAWLFAPEGGLVARARARARRRRRFAVAMLTIHLLHHEGSPEEERECRPEHLQEHLRWEPDRARRVVEGAVRKGLVERRESGLLGLTEAGRRVARRAVVMS
jgi:manganese/zinc/iron transport system permease protein